MDPRFSEMAVWLDYVNSIQIMVARANAAARAEHVQAMTNWGANVEQTGKRFVEPIAPNRLECVIDHDARKVSIVITKEPVVKLNSETFLVAKRTDDPAWPGSPIGLPIPDQPKRFHCSSWDTFYEGKEYVRNDGAIFLKVRTHIMSWAWIQIS